MGWGQELGCRRSGDGLAGGWGGTQKGGWYYKGPNPRLTHLSALVLVHVSYLDGKGNLAPQGSGKGQCGEWALCLDVPPLGAEGGASTPLSLHLTRIFRA